MLKLTEKIGTCNHADTTVTLALHERQKCRLRVMLDDEREAGIMLPRGTTTCDGDCLRSEDGHTTVSVVAAHEHLSVVQSADHHALARACYHLGNRHVSIQIEATKISFLHDHVLDDMLLGLGFDVTHVDAPFEPEPGAYGGSVLHAHSHEH